MATAILKLRGKSVPFIIEKTRMIILAMTGNLFFDKLNPELKDVGDRVDELELKYQDTINGGKLRKLLVSAHFAACIIIAYNLLVIPFL